MWTVFLFVLLAILTASFAFLPFAADGAWAIYVINATFIAGNAGAVYWSEVTQRDFLRNCPWAARLLNAKNREEAQEMLHDIEQQVLLSSLRDSKEKPQ